MTHLRLPLLAALLALPSLADAQEVPVIALLPFHGVPDARSADLGVAVRGLAAAIQEDGRLLPLYDTELATRGTEDVEERFREARDALAEGRRTMVEDDPEIAMMFLEEAVAAHTDTRSKWWHLDEAADAHFALSRALLGSGDYDRAEGEMLEAVRLVPDYMDTRADTTDPAIVGLANAAGDTSRRDGPIRLDDLMALELGNQVGAEFLVHGAVDGQGRLEVAVFAGPELLYTAQRPGPFRVPKVGHIWYDELAAQVVAACMGEPIPEARVITADETISGRGDGRTSVDEPPDRPRRGLWAIWVVSGAVAAGATTAVALTNRPEPEEPVGTWTLNVELP